MSGERRYPPHLALACHVTKLPPPSPQPPPLSRSRTYGSTMALEEAARPQTEVGPTPPHLGVVLAATPP